MLPILYSYRRCPYAMRARMALKVAMVEIEVREISLRDKPKHMLKVSPKGTVPVLVLPDGQVLEQSLDIMHWALQQQDPQCWLQSNQDQTQTLVQQNDTSFKQALDRYKYPERYPENSPLSYQKQGETFLQQLEALLEHQQYLLKATPSLADVAIFPFIRQFAAVDSDWFAQSPYQKLNAWLQNWVNSDLFESVMQKYPTYRDE